MQATALVEIRCIAALIRLEAAVAQNETEELVWLATLPFVYNDTSSAFFEEQLIVRLSFIGEMAGRNRMHHLPGLARVHVCIAQLQERAEDLLAALQDLQTCMNTSCPHRS